MESLREFLRISLKIQPWKLGRQGRRRAQRQKRRTPCQKKSLNNINKINYHTLTICYVLALAGCVCVCACACEVASVTADSLQPHGL